MGGGRFEVRTDTATLTVDRSVGEGGSGGAFRPVELLLAAIGACTAGTIRTFAVNESIVGFGGVNVLVEAEEASKPERIGTVSVTLQFASEIATSDVARLSRVGAHCKIHNTLKRPPETTIGVQDYPMAPTSDGGERTLDQNETENSSGLV